MTNGKQRWGLTRADEPPLDGSLYWDRWARRLALAAGNATAPDAVAGHLTTASAHLTRVHCYRHRVTANLERMIEELHEEAERVNEQAAELLLTELA